VTVDDNDWLAERFEGKRPHPRAVAYRMLGSPNEADKAVQEAWLRLSRSDASEIQNLGRLADELSRRPSRGQGCRVDAWVS
jgi:DNA-directed RNA polymerase specialized sigma24 family protein